MPLSRRRFLTLAASSPIAIALSGCLGSNDPDVVVIADGMDVSGPVISAAPVATGTPAPLPFTPTPVPNQLDLEDLHGFTMPVPAACLPGSDQLMPNAPREYRSGVHEGVDFYWGDSCVVIDRGTPVVAMFAGIVTRADHGYEELTPDLEAELARRTAEQGFSDEETLDIYRGRQVWIDHGSGIVTRYCHLDSIHGQIIEGLEVAASDLLGGIGESGTPESVTAPNTELHLHAEVRTGDSFLGAGQPPEVVRQLYNRLFQPAAPPAV